MARKRRHSKAPARISNDACQGDQGATAFPATPVSHGYVSSSTSCICCYRPTTNTGGHSAAVLLIPCTHALAFSLCRPLDAHQGGPLIENDAPAEAAATAPEQMSAADAKRLLCLAVAARSQGAAHPATLSATSSTSSSSAKAAGGSDGAGMDPVIMAQSLLQQLDDLQQLQCTAADNGDTSSVASGAAALLDVYNTWKQQYATALAPAATGTAVATGAGPSHVLASLVSTASQLMEDAVGWLSEVGALGYEPWGFPLESTSHAYCLRSTQRGCQTCAVILQLTAAPGVPAGAQCPYSTNHFTVLQTLTHPIFSSTCCHAPGVPPCSRGSAGRSCKHRWSCGGHHIARADNTDRDHTCCEGELGQEE
jgi:hypothetical protein